MNKVHTTPVLDNLHLHKGRRVNGLNEDRKEACIARNPLPEECNPPCHVRTSTCCEPGREGSTQILKADSVIKAREKRVVVSHDINPAASQENQARIGGCTSS